MGGGEVKLHVFLLSALDWLLSFMLLLVYAQVLSSGYSPSKKQKHFVPARAATPVFIPDLFTRNRNLIACVHAVTLTHFMPINSTLNYLFKFYFCLVLFWFVVGWSCPFNEVSNQRHYLQMTFWHIGNVAIISGVKLFFYSILIITYSFLFIVSFHFSMQWNEMVYLEHNFVCGWNSDTSENVSDIPWKFLMSSLIYRLKKWKSII
jgi:hypothetical protein